ncbi:RcnB family protein [Pseudorhodobacter aquimaris]|uniref:RcnB family protein n=1 Tax=Pseudorhodobacter aquimaris TaxID=687412 RepID=UPI00067B06C8|nr:RcnB family protein [Pseudorhodobacter aquimaris]
MQHLMKRCATILVLATTAVAVVPMTAMADKVVIKKAPYSNNTKVKIPYSHGPKVKVVKQQRHRHAVGYQFRKQDIIVVKDWKKRGLPNPGRNEVYVSDGSDIYLAVAATLLVTALIN